MHFHSTIGTCAEKMSLLRQATIASNLASGPESAYTTALALFHAQESVTPMSNVGTRLVSASVLALAMVAMVTAQPATDGKWRLGVKIFPAKGGGVKIAEVIPNSPAAEIGLKPGNVLLVLAGKLVNKTEDVQEKVFAAGNDLDIIYEDGGSFYQVTAPLVSVTYSAVVEGKTVERTKLAPKDGKPKAKKVADPRGKKSP